MRECPPSNDTKKPAKPWTVSVWRIACRTGQPTLRGQQQRVAIARAIINQPSLLLADEPTGALDSRTTDDVLNLFDALHAQGITLVLVTHEDDVAARAERVAHFRDGRIERWNERPKPAGWSGTG